MLELFLKMTQGSLGHCHVAWDTVCGSMDLGGVGISNLRN
jgi:hypothetical protein